MAAASEQNYANHARFIYGFHFVLAALLGAGLVGSINNFVRSLGDHSRLYNAALIVLLEIVGVFFFYFVRVFPLKAQDRAIRAEENLRHYVLTGKLLDARLSVKQIVALRFASDGEFPALAMKAAEESLEPDAIKRAVQSWRADTYRV
jgi:hypothetical protein